MPGTAWASGAWVSTQCRTNSSWVSSGRRVSSEMLFIIPDLRSTGAAAVEKQRHRVARPSRQLRGTQWRGEAKRAPLRPGDDHQDEFLGGKSRVDRTQFA